MVKNKLSALAGVAVIYEKDTALFLRIVMFSCFNWCVFFFMLHVKMPKIGITVKVTTITAAGNGSGWGFGFGFSMVKSWVFDAAVFPAASVA